MCELFAVGRLQLPFWPNTTKLTAEESCLLRAQLFPSTCGDIFQSGYVKPMRCERGCSVAFQSSVFSETSIGRSLFIR